MTKVKDEPQGAQNQTEPSILVNPRQRGNQILQLIKNVPWKFDDSILADFQVGLNSCVLFLSLRFHQSNPTYIDQRVNELGNLFIVRILLVHCDIDEPESIIKELTSMAINKNLTLMIGWNSMEMARYVELYKQFENKSPNWIKEWIGDDFKEHYSNAIRKIKGITKTDVKTVSNKYGSFAALTRCTFQQLQDCPGIGEKKRQNIIESFHQPFQIGNLLSFRERQKRLEEKQKQDSKDVNILPLPSISNESDKGYGILATNLGQQQTNQSDQELEGAMEEFDKMMEGLNENERIRLDV